MLFIFPAIPSLPAVIQTAVSFFLPCTYKSFPSVTQDFRSAVIEAEGEEGEPVLEEQKLGEILGVLPQVYALHSSILTELEERISQW